MRELYGTDSEAEDEAGLSVAEAMSVASVADEKAPEVAEEESEEIMFLPAPQTQGGGRRVVSPRPQRKLVVAGTAAKQPKPSKLGKLKAVEYQPRTHVAAPDLPKKFRQQSLIVQPSAAAMTDHTSYNHLIEGDYAPIGRVHLVALGPDTGDQHEEHFLTQMDADSNMGAQNLRMSSRRGPFRASKGRSRIMDRSAHVSYRRRGHTIEITVRRGISEQEMDNLIGKLSAHRIASQQAILYILSTRRKKMGTLDRIDMKKLRSHIYDELDKRATIGLLVQDVYTKGLLHTGFSHSRMSKSNNKMLLAR